MTRDKDRKRIVRARMGKTGESYTAARAALLRKAGDTARGTSHAGREAVTRDAVPRAQWPALAGSSDEAVRKATGRTWAGWVGELDALGAHALPHREIARLLDGGAHALGGWWAQMVTVGYERIRGLRDVGQRRGGSYEANKSRTFPVHVSTLYRACADARRRRRWLTGGWKRVRASIEDRSLRVDWDDGTRVQLVFVAKGSGKSTLAVQHARLADREAVDRAKAFWHARLDALGESLVPAGARAS